MLNQVTISMCYLSKVSWPFPCSSKSFLNCRLTSTRLLIKWFLIKRTLYAYHRGIAQFEDSTLQIQVNYLISKHYEIIFDLNYT